MDVNDCQKNITNAGLSLEMIDLCAKRYLTYTIGVGVHFYYLPLVTVFGFIGNVFCLLVSLQRQNRRISCCIYMSALALSDNCMLILGFYYWIRTGVLDRDVSDLECHISAWLFLACACSGVYIVFFMTLDRYLAVCHPHHWTYWRHVKNAQKVVSVTITVLIVYSLPFFFYSKMVSKRYCVGLAFKTTFTQWYSWCNIILVSILPSVGILVMNCFIINAVWKRRGRIRKLNSMPHLGKLKTAEVCFVKMYEQSKNNDSYKHKSQGHKECRESQLAAMLVFVSFALIVLTLPQYLKSVIYNLFIDKQSDPSTYATYILVYNLTNKIYFTNNAVNFYLYCLSSTKYRKDFLSLVSSRS